MTTPSFRDTIRQLIEERVAELRVSLPAKIVAYDPSKRRANVKPLINRKLRNGTTLILPVIVGVPVIFPGMQDAELTFPASQVIGGICTLQFADRSLDEFLLKGGEVTPESARKHHINDAQAIIGLRTFVDAPADPDDVVLRFRDSEVRIRDNGDVVGKAASGSKVAFGTPDQEVLDLLSQTMGRLTDLVDALLSAVTATALGAQPLSIVPSGELATIKGNIEILSADLDTIKGTV